jgi:hypothetical protein
MLVLPAPEGRNPKFENRNSKLDKQDERPIFEFRFSSFEIHPWRCLCFGFSQITRTTPLRRTILHFAQILRTEERTFIS